MRTNNQSSETNSTNSYVTLYYITSFDSNNVSFNPCYAEALENIGVGIYQGIRDKAIEETMGSTWYWGNV